MKIMIKAIIIFCLLFISSHRSIAGELVYNCTVMHLYDLEDNGSLRMSNWKDQFGGSEFSVSRVTGEIIGEVVPTLLARSTKIIRKGNKEYSFKSIADFENQVQLIEIQEFIQGKEKPFIAMSMGYAGIVTGLCR